MGVVLQDPADNLLEQLSVVEQVELAAQLRGADPAGAVALLEAVGLADRAGSALPELSGGEQQRVAFARSEEHTSELQSLMRISYAVFCLKKKTNRDTKNNS